MNKSIELSIVSPLFNESTNVRTFVGSLTRVLQDLNIAYEIVLVDDGSTDDTWQEIELVSLENPNVVAVKLSKNFGHQGALLAGLDVASGRAVVSMDGDMQHPSEVIPNLVDEWKNGSKIVLTQRISGQETSKFKKESSNYFYKFLSSIADTPIEQGSSDFRLLDRQALDELLKLNFGKPFLRVSVNSLGYKTSVVQFKVAERHSGESKYSLKKMIQFGLGGLVSHSHVPLTLGIYLGVITGFFSALELLYVLVQVVLGNTVPGWASTMGLMSLLFSILFIILGVIGIYIADIHTLLKNKPHFIIDKISKSADSKD